MKRAKTRHRQLRMRGKWRYGEVQWIFDFSANKAYRTAPDLIVTFQGAPVPLTRC